MPESNQMFRKASGDIADFYKVYSLLFVDVIMQKRTNDSANIIADTYI